MYSRNFTTTGRNLSKLDLENVLIDTQNDLTSTWDTSETVARPTVLHEKRFLSVSFAMGAKPDRKYLDKVVPAPPDEDWNIHLEGKGLKAEGKMEEFITWITGIVEKKTCVGFQALLRSKITSAVDETISNLEDFEGAPAESIPKIQIMSKDILQSIRQEYSDLVFDETKVNDDRTIVYDILGKFSSDDMRVNEEPTESGYGLYCDASVIKTAVDKTCPSRDKNIGGSCKNNTQRRGEEGFRP